MNILIESILNISLCKHCSEKKVFLLTYQVMGNSNPSPPPCPNPNISITVQLKSGHTLPMTVNRHINCLGLKNVISKY